MALVTTEASPRKKALCPFCGSAMDYKGDGRYVCPQGCGEFLRQDTASDEPEDQRLVSHVPEMWPELVVGTGGAMRDAMKAVATMPLGTADVVGPCQGHGGKGGGKSGRGKSPARQKMDAWRRKTAPGMFIRSCR